MQWKNVRTVPSGLGVMSALGLINCVLIFEAFILVYSIRRLLCCWPSWGYIVLLPQSIVWSNNIPASPPPTKPISAPCQWTSTNLRRRKSSAQVFMLRGVSGNARKNSMMHRKIHRKNDRTNMDPSLSGPRSPLPATWWVDSKTKINKHPFHPDLVWSAVRL